ncbi:signal recognition particle-docking protein FtsY [Desulfoprunum benzoelyticum]|uniref:Signal recognition particle receptor FtsY n=1 Tax=Desulfoprunum benzoelyticum TaxID=1506996 RepID=A0A840UV93_9BACT|nr:signal recognition particle-docking protein FtsY [Desulfoprunum benzoelyticum]MBB5346638.1 fused signal recognition particle receptor [Desulfoprunum benzoelyticum]MBM9529117.1 signal recognition particle-docking protein FtsY [Desulfoprunum benzoelyticum]
MLGWFKKKFSKKGETPAATPDTQLPAAAPEATSPDPAVTVVEEAVTTVEAAVEATVEATVEAETAAATAPEIPVATEPVAESPAEPVPEAATAVEPRADTEEEEEPEAEEAGAARSRPSFLRRLAEKLSKTREAFTYQLDRLFLGRKEIDAELFDDLEELLITADLGVTTTRELLDHARRKVHRKELSDPESLKLALKDKIKSFIIDYQRDAELVMPESGPFVIMVVGVNGVGKTTTIGKIAHKFVKAGRSVMLVAGDTFRAAAVSQLQIWGERNGVHVVARADRADPSSVVYDAMDIAKAKNYDVVLVDTAGRLHTQTNLMEELKKIKRVMGKRLEGAPHEVMLVIDATTGQNGISQAKLFHEAVGITGITLTKLDGTAKGGIVANICREMKTPIRFIGVGEKMEDLRDFDPDEFIEALFESRLP